MASQPAASARPTRLATRSSQVDQYSWNHRGLCPIAAAQSSIGRDAWFEKMNGTPCSAAAFATATSASRCRMPSAPIGARSNGAGSRRPNSSTEVSRTETSRSILGTS